MSEPTLYRIEYGVPECEDTWVAVLQDGGLLVPVERCDLFVGTTGDKDAKIHRIEWCSGAGIGDNDVR